MGEIINDGVDVKKCIYLNPFNEYECFLYASTASEPFCEGTNCYYKQLQRKIKECYDLKSVMKQFAFDFEDKGENPDLSEMIQIAQQTLERWENDRTSDN